MYRPLIVICILPLIAGCYLKKFPPPKVPNEYINIFTESIVRMRDGNDPNVLNLNEGQRIGERAFKRVGFSDLLHSFEWLGGKCYPSERAANSYVCTMTRVVSMNPGQLGTTVRPPCDHLVYLTYEFYYPRRVSSYALWESMHFYAKTGNRNNCRAQIVGADYESHPSM